MWNIFKTDNKDIKKEHDKDMFVVQQKSTLKKKLDMWIFVNKETQSLLLTFDRFHILF